MGGIWGDAINWFPSDQFDDIKSLKKLKKTKFQVVGWKSPGRPNEGETLYGNFAQAHILFKFVDVELKSNPRDMFFGTVKFLELEEKTELTNAAESK